jgi:hypothetical protein
VIGCGAVFEPLATNAAQLFEVSEFITSLAGAAAWPFATRAQ